MEALKGRSCAGLSPPARRHGGKSAAPPPAGGAVGSPGVGIGWPGAAAIGTWVVRQGGNWSPAAAASIPAIGAMGAKAFGIGGAGVGTVLPPGAAAAPGGGIADALKGMAPPAEAPGKFKPCTGTKLPHAGPVPTIEGPAPTGRMGAKPAWRGAFGITSSRAVR